MCSDANFLLTILLFAIRNPQRVDYAHANRARQWMRDNPTAFEIACAYADHDPESVRIKTSRLKLTKPKPARDDFVSSRILPKRKYRQGKRGSCGALHRHDDGREFTVRQWVEVLGTIPSTIHCQLRRGRTITQIVDGYEQKRSHLLSKEPPGVDANLLQSQGDRLSRPARDLPETGFLQGNGNPVTEQEDAA